MNSPIKTLAKYGVRPRKKYGQNFLIDMNVIRRIVEAGIPVLGHVGLVPQSVHLLGGYGVRGREDGQAVMDDAVALEEACAFAVVLEKIPRALATDISEKLAIPTIGIGAGSAVDGQVLVFHDLLGFHQDHLPKFVRSYGPLFDDAVAALRVFFSDVETGDFPGEEESYVMPEEVARALRAEVSGSAG